MVGGGAAVLAGLVFVAMSLNLRELLEDASHRSRAVSTLAGFAGAFILCGLALLGEQPPWALGFEWLAVAAVVGIIYAAGYFSAVRAGFVPKTLKRGRLVLGLGLCIAQAAGAIAFLAGHFVGLYVAAVALMLFFGLLISGAWLLLVGIFEDERRKET